MSPIRRVNRGGGHSYFDDDNGGRKVPGVTRYLDALPKGGLVPWAAGCTADFVADRLELVDGHYLADQLMVDLRAQSKYPLPEGLPRTKIATELKWQHKRERDAAANRGTEVHKLAQRLALGEEVQVPEALVGHVDSYLKFRTEWEPADEIVELPIVNRSHFYAGTLDLICSIEDLGRCLIDIKTGRSGIFGEVALQLAAYRYAEHYLDADKAEQPMVEVDGCFGLWVRADGYDLIPIEAGPAEYRVFRYLQQVAMFMNGPDLTGVDAPAPVQAVKGEALLPPARVAS